MDDIIAKARYTETFLSASVTLGITEDLDELAKLGDLDEEGMNVVIVDVIAFVLFCC